MLKEFLLIIYLGLLPLMDRWGGGDLGFLGIKDLPKAFTKGFKPVRRYGIPLALFLLAPTLENAVLMVILGTVLSFNLNEIEARNWEEIALWSATYFFTLRLVAGPFGLLPALWWPLGIYLSNFGIRGRKLPWQYVELTRGLLLAIGVGAYAIL